MIGTPASAPPFFLPAGSTLGQAVPSGNTLYGTDANDNPGMAPASGPGSYLFNAGGGVVITGGASSTMDGVVIGGSTSADGTFNTVNAKSGVINVISSPGVQVELYVNSTNTLNFSGYFSGAAIQLFDVATPSAPTGAFKFYSSSGIATIQNTGEATGFAVARLGVPASFTALTLSLSGHATGDIYYDAGSGVFARLPVATSTLQFLGLSGGLPAYVSIGGIVVSSAKLTAQSGAVSSVVAYTVPNDGSPHLLTVTPTVAITAISAGTLTVQVSFTDGNNTSQTVSYFPMGLTAAGLTTTGYTAFAPCCVQCKANTTATVKTTFTGVSITYDIAASIKLDV